MTPKDNTETARAAALKLLQRGIASPAEVAELAQVSRQLCNFWIRAADIDWRAARAAALGRAWRKAMKS